MRRAAAVLVLPFLFACSDTPTQAPIDVEPQFTMEAGSGATWYFEAVVTSVGGAPSYPVAVGDLVTGQLTFTIAGPEDYWPPIGDCLDGYKAHTVWQYTVEGTTRVAEGDGYAMSFPECPANGYPHNQIFSDLYDDLGQWTGSWYLFLYNNDATSDFPLVPPALGQGWLQRFQDYDSNNVGFMAELTALYAGPQAKDDCKNGGWEKYGFKNQGQCVRYVETGKDSR